MEKTERPSFKYNRETAKAMSDFDKGLSSIAGFEDKYDKDIIRLSDAILSEEKARILSSMSVSELAKAKLGIRTQALKEAGITNILQLSRMQESALAQIKGIGPKSVNGIKSAVNQIVDSVNNNTKLKIDPTNPSKLYDELVRQLYISRHGKRVSEESRKLYDDYHKQVKTLLKQSRPARSWFLWTISSEKKREISIQSLKQIQELLYSNYTSKVNAFVQDKARILKVSHDEYWNDFKNNAAAYYSTLDKIKNKKTNKGGTEYKKNQTIAIQNGMSPELAVAISNVKLNLIGLRADLRSYQEYGVQFILKQGAVLLGDDMGLGKTVQAIATMVCLRNSGDTHFLVVCPASVLVNWSREVDTWCDIPSYIIHGGSVLSDFDKWIRSGGIGITTYETLSKLTLPNGFTYSMLVVDEAHYIKNPQASRTRNVLYFRQRTSKALFMTGTPIENRVEEMCFLIGCLQPDVAKRVSGSTSLAMAPQFRQHVAPVYFRRTKEDVLDELPEKIEKTEWVELCDDEKQLYRGYVHEKDFSGMRQVSWKIANPSESSKGVRLQELVDEAIREGRKVIVFSFFLNTIDRVGMMIKEKTFGPITGSISPQRRQQILDSFKEFEGGAVLLSQIQAGGTGLNIQTASVIIFCEPQLKPSIENQATARAYRMGQINTVLVYHLLCAHTVDERIDVILKRKQELFDNFAHESVSGQESLVSNAEISSIISEEQKMWA